MSNDLKERTKGFALETIRFVQTLPRNLTCDIIGRQLLRSGTSVGANYRAASRGRSKPDFIAKMGIVEEEADECVYWLELLVGDGKVQPAKAAWLIKEAGELTAIAAASIITARGGKRVENRHI